MQTLNHQQQSETPMSARTATPRGSATGSDRPEPTVEPLVWTELMTLSLEGDRLAYRDLLIHFADHLESYFKRTAPGRHAPGLVRDTLRSVHLKLGTCDPSFAILPWLTAIADYRRDRPSQNPSMH